MGDRQNQNNTINLEETESLTNTPISYITRAEKMLAENIPMLMDPKG